MDLLTVAVQHSLNLHWYLFSMHAITEIALL